MNIKSTCLNLTFNIFVLHWKFSSKTSVFLTISLCKYYNKQIIINKKKYKNKCILEHART